MKNELLHYVAKDCYHFESLFEVAYLNEETGNIEYKKIIAKELWLGSHDSIDNYLEMPD